MYAIRSYYGPNIGLIASLFMEALLQVPLKWPIGLLFTGATLAMVTGLAYFLREVQLSTSMVRIRNNFV